MEDIPMNVLILVLLAVIGVFVFLVMQYVYCLHENKKKIRGRCIYTTALLEAWYRAHPNETIDNEVFKDLVIEAFMARLMFKELFGKEYDENTEYLRNLFWGNKVAPFRKLHLVV